MRIGYVNGIIEDQLVASASLSLNYPISNVLDLHMTEKYKSLGSGSLLVTMRDTSINGSFLEGKKIFADDIQASDNFGTTVSISGRYAIVGAYGEDTGEDSAGSVYVFYRSNIDATLWNNQVKLINEDPEINDEFGSSVDIDGDYLIVGAHSDNEEGSNAGASYIYHRVGTNSWGEVTKIVASDSAIDDNFGVSVAISGDYAIVGADSKDTSTGACYIFHRTGTNTWDTGTKVTASDAQTGDLFGASVDIDGDYAIVGAWGEDTVASLAGACYIFHRTGTNTWDTGFKLQASDAQSDDRFGTSVAITTSSLTSIDDWIVVGSPLEDGGAGDPTSSSGAAYIYHRTDTNTWDDETIIRPISPQVNGVFGKSVAINEDNIIVGAPSEDSSNGAIYLFYLDGLSWFFNSRITSSDAKSGSAYGSSVMLDGLWYIIGAPTDNTNGSFSGSAYIPDPLETVDIGTQSISASMCVINAHNMISGDTAILRGYTSSTLDTASVNYAFTFQEYGMAIIFDEGTYFWEIELNVTNPVEIGGIFLGQHLITPAYEIGAKTDHVTHDSYSMSGSGQLFGDEGYEGRKNNWLFPWITETEKPDWLTFFRAVGTIVPFYLLQYPDRQDIQPVIYCHRTNKTFKLEEHEGNRSLYKDIPLSTEEVF